MPLQGSGARGRWLVIAIFAIALLLGLVALRYRQFLPRPQPPVTPATQPISP
jgi:hypothetical protein